MQHAMDYCHACRRHLNGALACAGCGTPAEYLPPAAPVAASVPGVPDASGFPPPSVPGPARGGFEDPFADSLVVLSGRHQGRAGSRRRATHRRRRRTAVLIGAGLVLAVGGSVVLARIVTEGERTDRAAQVVLTDGNGPQEPAPLPSRTGAPAAPSALKPVKSAGAAKATAGATQSAGAEVSAAGTAQPGPGVSPSASGKAVPSASASGAGPSVKPGQSGQPTPTGSGTANPPPNPAPSPTPKPTKTGCWFIFFC
ncbi:hypothetical protein AB0B01_07395 [Streptomyces sp. NPDC044571]|uniref:SCO2400 family protein n=1 Tax=Streptomyces sp. NPDC044571 TaxID=3155371 RepID=UPI00340FAC6A